MHAKCRQDWKRDLLDMTEGSTTSECASRAVVIMRTYRGGRRNAAGSGSAGTKPTARRIGRVAIGDSGVRGEDGLTGKRSRCRPTAVCGVKYYVGFCGVLLMPPARQNSRMLDAPAQGRLQQPEEPPHIPVRQARPRGFWNELNTTHHSPPSYVHLPCNPLLRTHFRSAILSRLCGHNALAGKAVST